MRRLNHQNAKELSAWSEDLFACTLSEDIQKMIVEYKPVLNEFDLARLLNDPRIKIKKYKTSYYVGILDAEKQKSGLGVLINKSGRVYEGNWERDEKQGFGLEIYPGKGFYLGDFKEGKRQGHGFFRWQNGDVFDGSWLDG